jgi:hypothetical protein
MIGAAGVYVAVRGPRTTSDLAHSETRAETDLERARPRLDR